MPETECGYYGKLPVSPEFLRWHASGPEMRELDDWFERGIQYAKGRAGSEWPGLVTQADIWNFLFVPTGEGRVICGAVFASRDRAGRSFPFLTFLLVDCPRVPPAPWLIPLQCRLFLDKTRQLLHQLRTDLDWNTFRTHTEHLATEIDADAMIETGFQDYLSRTTVNEFRNGLTGAAHIDGGLADEASHRPVLGSVSRVESGGRRLPLLKGCKAETYDMPFWLELHARTTGVPLSPMSASIAFWNRDSAKVESCALLSIGCPSPNLARFIVSPDVSDEAWASGMAWSTNRQESISCEPTGSPAYADFDGTLSLRQYLDSMS
ncbi:MAG: type VI secretion system-associated protein TagF [Nitrospira sp.]